MSTIASSDVRDDALRMLSNGVYLLTSCTGDALHAASVSWVSQVSFQPPLIMVALRRNSHLAHAVRQARRFSLNILAADQRPIAETFFEHQTAAVDTEAISGHAFRMSASRCPLLIDAMAWLECRFAAEPDTPGDHALFLGTVTGAGIRRAGTPMVLWDTPWCYGGLRRDRDDAART